MAGRRLIRGLCFAFALLLLLPMAQSAFAAESEDSDPNERKVLRVAFPQTIGISETDDDGTRHGLLVDYLEEIAKYTDWEYEYIDVDAEQLIPDFLDGKFDLMGGTFYSPDFEEYFAYSEFNSGRSKATLLCNKSDTRFKSYNLASINGATIGVYEKATEKIEYLKKFLDDNNLQCNLKYYSREQQQDDRLYAYVRSGEVDLLLGNDNEVVDDLQILTTFNAQPYYIVTTPGNDEVLAGLNMALEKILEADPDFEEDHYQANFPGIMSRQIMFRDEELAYIKNKQEVSVAIMSSWHPFYCAEDERELHNGVIPDILTRISEITGLKFKYVYAEDYAEAMEFVQKGKADMLGCYIGDNEMAANEGLALTKAFLNMNNIIIKNKSVSYPDDGLTCAVLKGRSLPKDIGAAYVAEYESLAEGLRAVDRGEADFVYALATSIEPEIQKYHFSNLVSVYLVNDYAEVSFALARPITPELLTILNKTLNFISDEEKSNILDQNIVSMGTSAMTLADMIYADPVTFIVILAVILILAMAFVLIAARARVRNSLMRAELEKAEAKSRAKGEFLSRMSHEIRTPMNAIVGLANLAGEAGDVPDQVRDKLDKIQVSSQYLLSLINDILDMSRIDSGKMEIVTGVFSMTQMGAEISSMMQVQAEQRGVTFNCHYDIRQEWVDSDGIRLRQVLVNLLSNAFKFTPAGRSVTISIVQTGETGTDVTYDFCVQDKGIGIAPQDQQRIFGAFEQISQNISKSEGTGLGLAISRNIVTLMGGELKLDSVPDQGSSFYFTLTLKKAEAPEAAPEEDKISLKGIHVLLAEDNEINAEIAMDFLKLKGATVDWVTNGRAALDHFADSIPGEYQCILMDIQMPVMNGLEACDNIRKCGHADAARIPVIAMTANSFREDAEDAQAAGMNGFVTKPVDFNYLLETIEKYVKLSHTAGI